MNLGTTNALSLACLQHKPWLAHCNTLALAIKRMSVDASSFTLAANFNILSDFRVRRQLETICMLCLLLLRRRRWRTRVRVVNLNLFMCTTQQH
jgi:hypothetical protein